MGVFDYISSLFDDKDGEEGDPQSDERSTLAPSLDPTQIEARHRQGKKKGAKPEATDDTPQRERRSKDALSAPPAETPAPAQPKAQATPAKVPQGAIAKSREVAKQAPPPRRESYDSLPARADVKPEAAQHANASPQGAAKAAAPVAPAPQAQAQPPQPAARAIPEVTESDADEAIDAVFGAGASQSVTHVSAIARELDEAAVRELYAGIASQHARPVKNFVFELKRGAAAKEWIEICRPVMATLIQGAEAMGLPDAARPMKDFDEALALATDSAGDTFDPTVRDLMLHAWDEMIEALPEAFQVGEDEKRRESVIIHSLLKQIPDIGTVTFERLYGAGLTTLEGLYLASKEDLSVTTGIPRHLCDRICDRVQEHRRDVERMQKQMGMIERKARLQLLYEELKKRHEGFEHAAAEEWRDKSLAHAKREHRQARHVVALKIEVVLAEMGELEVVEHLQKLPYARRIEQLAEFIKLIPDAPVASASADMVPAHGAAGR